MIRERLWQDALAATASRYHPFVRRWQTRQEVVRDRLRAVDLTGVGVYGMGTLGRLLLAELDALGKRPSHIVDNQRELAGGRFLGVPVIEEYLLWRLPELERLVITPIFDVAEVTARLDRQSVDLCALIGVERGG